MYPFGHFDRELLTLVNAGLTPTQAIVAGTSNNAELLGIGDIIGTVEAGKSADLLVVEGNPSVNITDIANVTAVFKAGTRTR